MRVLLIHSHPRADSFNAALARAVRETLQAGGHEVEFRDLHAEGFDPVLSAEERGRYHDVPDNLTGLESHAEALRRAEALVLVYPTWWYGMPAMLKGWFDKVWAPGLAFHLGPPGSNVAITPGLRHIRRVAVVTTYGSPRWLLWFIGHPDRKLIGRGLRRLCARGCRLDWHSLTRMDGRTRAECDAFLTEVRAAFARW